VGQAVTGCLIHVWLMVVDGFKPSDKPLQMIAVLIGGAITILKNMSY
jgi:hypothetical protein